MTRAHNSAITRRGFLDRAAFAAGVTVAAPQLIPSGVLAQPGRKGANERLGIGFIGMGGRGLGLYREMRPLYEKGECHTVAVCDVDESRLE